MAGLSAAASAARAGARVVLVEKGELGGSAKMARYIWTAPSYEALREAVPEGDPELGAALSEGIEPALEWVRSLGVDVPPAVTVLRFGRGHRVSMPDYLDACEQIVRAANGSEILLGAAPRRLVVEDGAVRGAEIELSDGVLRIVRAGATLMATGGFQADPELRSELIHPLARKSPLRSNPYSSGDGLRLGRAVGAQFGAEDAGFYGHTMAAGVELRHGDDLPSLTLFHSEHGVLLNLESRRFVDETVGDHLTTLALLRQPEARALLITDERVRQEWILKPYVEGIPAVDTFEEPRRRGARATVLQDLSELRDLPASWGYDGQAIYEALLEFNRSCGSRDLDPPREFDANPIDQAPFYVVEALPAITFTFGGLRIDAQARVLDEGGAPVPGLLAAGADAGGLYVRAYAGGLAAALVFGIRAAATALGRSELTASRSSR
jgi:succinate dehydrogenase/fumarate reductase flavoprotein subunit